jgi:hypothetical protein
LCLGRHRNLAERGFYAYRRLVFLLFLFAADFDFALLGGFAADFPVLARLPGMPHLQHAIFQRAADFSMMSSQDRPVNSEKPMAPVTDSSR